MSTKTRRQERQELHGWLARLAALVATAITLIEKKTRASQMIQTLLLALQLFKENRLAAVIAIERGAPKDLPENFAELLSLKIQDLPLKKQVKTYFLKQGIWYLGELYRILGSEQARKVTAVQIAVDYLLSLGLPAELDPIEAGWRPPYWDSQEFLRGLTYAVIEAMGKTDVARRAHGRGVHYIGELFVARKLFGFGSAEKKHGMLGRARRLGVHYGLYLPPDWQPPEGVPKSWLEHKAKQQEERRIQYAEKVQRVKAQAPSDVVVERESLRFEILFGFVADWELSVRAYNALRNLGIEYNGQVAQKTEVELLKGKVGRKSLKEVKRELEEVGLGLGLPQENPVIAAFNRMLAVR